MQHDKRLQPALHYADEDGEATAASIHDYLHKKRKAVTAASIQILLAGAICIWDIGFQEESLSNVATSHRIQLGIWVSFGRYRYLDTDGGSSVNNRRFCLYSAQLCGENVHIHRGPT